MPPSGLARRLGPGMHPGLKVAVAASAALLLLAIVLALRAGAPASGDAEPIYYAIPALDQPPAPLTSPDECYPYGATGEVTYELMIDESGLVTRATVLDVKPQGLFTAAAAELCGRLKFSPAIKDGRTVRSRVRFVIGPR